MALMFLREITNVRRVDLKLYCLEIATKDKTYFISFKNDDELYSWMDEIYKVHIIINEFLIVRDLLSVHQNLPILFTKFMSGSILFLEDLRFHLHFVFHFRDFQLTGGAC